MAGILGICGLYFISCSSGETSTHPPWPGEGDTNTNDNIQKFPRIPVVQEDGGNGASGVGASGPIVTGTGAEGAGASGTGTSTSTGGNEGAGGDGDTQCSDLPKHQCKFCCWKEKWACIKACDGFCGEEEDPYKECVEQCVINYWHCKSDC